MNIPSPSSSPAPTFVEFKEPGKVVPPDAGTENTRFVDGITGKVGNVETPNSARKLVNYTLNPSRKYVIVTVVTRNGVVVTTTFGAETNVTNKQPNVPRDGTGWMGFFVYDVTEASPTPVDKV